MSTTFAIISPNEEEGFKRLDIAHRSGIGNGLVKIKWLDFNLRQLLDVLDVERFNKLGFKDLRPYNIHVQAMDNTAQGVKTIGDLMVLDKFGTLKFKNSSIEEDDKNESNADKIKALTKRIEAVETLFNNINEINYINKTKGDKNETK
jgi:hypothetical protein